jgi:isoquinoline 1-oxidoreductase beta subunit
MKQDLMKNSLENTSRRDFLVKSAATTGALAIGFKLPGLANAAPAPDYGSEVTHWVVIQPDDQVMIRIARSELGQGSFTGLAQLVAEELQCDWSKVHPVYADVNMHIQRNRIFKSMSTGGSRSIRDSQEYIRTAGAAARQMLVAAAAREWGVPASECSAQDSIISHPSGKRTTYGKVAAAASTMEIPTDITLKAPAEWKIAGTSPARFDIPAKTNGSQVYASDVHLPGMLYASVMRSPVFGAKLKSHDESKAMAMRGVRKPWRCVASSRWSPMKTGSRWSLTTGGAPTRRCLPCQSNGTKASMTAFPVNRSCSSCAPVSMPTMCRSRAKTVRSRRLLPGRRK